MGHTYTANWGNNNNLEEDCLEYLCSLQEMALSMCLRNNFFLYKLKVYKCHKCWTSHNQQVLVQSRIEQ